MRVCKIYPIFLALNKQDFWTLDNVHLFVRIFCITLHIFHFYFFCSVKSIVALHMISPVFIWNKSQNLIKEAANNETSGAELAGA